MSHPAYQGLSQLALEAEFRQLAHKGLDCVAAVEPFLYSASVVIDYFSRLGVIVVHVATNLPRRPENGNQINQTDAFQSLWAPTISIHLPCFAFGTLDDVSDHFSSLLAKRGEYTSIRIPLVFP
jgi:hypothetical protein